MTIVGSAYSARRAEARLAKKPFRLRSTRALFFFEWPNFEFVKLVGVYLTQFGGIKRNQTG
jgi:hypothetical protein